MRVGDLYDDVSAALGKCSEPTVFRRLTDAVRLLGNKGLFDANVGCMNLTVSDGCITLPPEVDTILAVNVGCRPTLMRDEWFQYHLNGVGSELQTDCGYTDVVSVNTPIIRCLTDTDYASVKLVLKSETVTDNNKAFRVYGWDIDGKRIFTEQDGVQKDGFVVPMVYGFPQVHASAPAIARIDRIEKDETNGYVELVAVDPLATSTELYRLGYYGPRETDPAYRRIRVNVDSSGQETTAVRISYRKKDTEIKSREDWINLDNREAIILAVKAVKFREANNFEQARSAESEAQRLLSEQVSAKKTTTALSSPQIMRTDSWDEEGGMFY